MTFYITEISEYYGELYMGTESGEIEFTADIDGAYDYDLDEWDEGRIRDLADSQVREAFGPSAKIVWG